VDVEARPGKAAPLWVWIFKIPDGDVNQGRQFWHNTSLSEAASFKLKEVFSAFRVPTNTNTDHLIGKRVKALVTRQVAEQGKRQGQFVNAIQELMPLGQATAPSPGAVKVSAGGGGNPTADDDEPPF
jgi:hypothetical protein